MLFVSQLPYFILGLLILRTLFFRLSDIVEIILYCLVAILCIVFSKTIGIWRAEVQKKVRANLENTHGLNDSWALFISYDWFGRKGNIWLFRILASILFCTSFLHLFKSIYF